MTLETMNKLSPPHSSRILDIPCKVCHDHSSGKHYGIYACDGCAGFFKRSIRRARQYLCKNQGRGTCPMDKTHRNQCRACRLKKCEEAGMNKDAVQHERGPRNSTIRRQMALYLKDAREISNTSPLNLSRPTPLFNGLLTTPDRLARMGSSPSFGPNTAAERYSPLSVSPLNSMAANLIYQQLSQLYPTKTVTESTETVCELAARILFLNVQWVKTVPVFRSLSFDDQVKLLEDSWTEMFVLAATQFQIAVDPEKLIDNTDFDDEREEMLRKIKSETKQLQEIIQKFREMQVDPTEYACLKGIIMFKSGFQKDLSPSSSPGLTDTLMNNLQDQAQLTLNKYTQMAYPSQVSRYAKLLLMIPSLSSVSASTIHSLFFKKTIGSTAVNKLLVDIYRSTNA